jgi:hypothetical protein
MEGRPIFMWRNGRFDPVPQNSGDALCILNRKRRCIFCVCRLRLQDRPLFSTAIQYGLAKRAFGSSASRPKKPFQARSPTGPLSVGNSAL